MNSVAIIGVALGMRHGADPDHLAAIDGLTRIRPRASNGVYSASGHAIVMIILAGGMGRLLAPVRIPGALEFDPARRCEFVGAPSSSEPASAS